MHLIWCEIHSREHCTFKQMYFIYRYVAFQFRVVRPTLARSWHQLASSAISSPTTPFAHGNPEEEEQPCISRLNVGRDARNVLQKQSSGYTECHVLFDAASHTHRHLLSKVLARLRHQRLDNLFALFCTCSADPTAHSSARRMNCASDCPRYPVQRLSCVHGAPRR